MAGLTIGKLSRSTGTKTETIRYYEKIGLLPKPPRTQGNYRAYGAEELARLSFVRRARDLGFSIEQVRALLELSDNRERSCHAIDVLSREHLATVDAKIADLMALRQELARLLEQCVQGTVAECRIIDALAPDDRKGSSQIDVPKARP